MALTFAKLAVCAPLATSVTLGIAGENRGVVFRVNAVLVFAIFCFAAVH